MKRSHVPSCLRLPIGAMLPCKYIYLKIQPFDLYTNTVGKNVGYEILAGSPKDARLRTLCTLTPSGSEEDEWGGRHAGRESSAQQ